MALVNQTLPFRTRRLGEYQQSRHRGGVAKRKGKSPDVRGAERLNRKRPLMAPKAITSAERRRCDRRYTCLKDLHRQSAVTSIAE
jgi:hypothetical protein